MRAMIARCISELPEKMRDGHRVAQQRVDAGLGDHARAAEDLDRVEPGLHRRLRDPQLAHRDRFVAALARAMQLAGAVQQQAAGLEPQLHVDDPVRDRLERADALPELRARAHVLDAALERALHRADVVREQAARAPRSSTR